MPSTHSSLHHSEHLYRKQMIHQSGSNIFRLKQPPTSQSPLPTPRETSIERSCPGIYPTQRVTIFSPQLAVERPKTIGVNPFSADKEEILF
jgi:hypothetical protein